MRIENKEIDVILLALGLRDVFAMLPDEKLVQLEVFADNGFADRAHGSVRESGAGCQAIKRLVN
jgi:hypothetical protein